MAHLLRFTGGASGGSAGYITHPSALSGATTFDVEIDFIPRIIYSAYYNVYSNNQANNLQRHAMYMWGNSRAEITFIIGGARKVLNSPLGTFTAGNRYKVNAVYDGSTLQMLVDGVSVASVAASGTVGGSGGLTQIGANISEARASIDLYRYKITENGIPVRDYDPSASGGTGTVLPDIINSANNGTQTGTWPANDSEWVFYDDGGTTYEGGGTCAFTVDANGGGVANRIGGGTTAFTINGVGGGVASRIGGGPSATAFSFVGSGVVNRAGGGGNSITFTMTGGGEVIPATDDITGGAVLPITFGMTGGGSVVRNAGAILSFSVTAAGSGFTNRVGGGDATLDVVASGMGFITVNGGGEITVHVDMYGGGNIQTPGYKPFVRTPTVVVNQTKRVPYAITVQKLFRGAVCRL